MELQEVFTTTLLSTFSYLWSTQQNLFLAEVSAKPYECEILSVQHLSDNLAWPILPGCPVNQLQTTNNDRGEQTTYGATGEIRNLEKPEIQNSRIPETPNLILHQLKHVLKVEEAGVSPDVKMVKSPEGPML